MTSTYMKRLGKYLKKLRSEADRSLRWVERKSRELYPGEEERQISNGYLYTVEQGGGVAISPKKLKTLAQIYRVDYTYLLELAGYLDEGDDDDAKAEIYAELNELTKEQQHLILEMIRHLKKAN
jgi:transcriptional regulator with XRE-family HTH domain